MATPLQRLAQLGLLKASFDRGSLTLAPGRELLQLCNAMALEGGLSVSSDVRPDELIGPLAMALGGKARELRVIEARDHPRQEMTVRLGEVERTWVVQDLEALVHHLNDLFKSDPSSRALAILGELEDQLQLWALDKRVLASLLGEELFRPRNRKDVAALAQKPTRW
jgi:hypothetical protein